MKKPEVIEVYADNGQLSHYALIDTETGNKLWSEEPEECKAMGYPVVNNDCIHSVMSSYNFAYIYIERKGFDKRIQLSGKTVEELREKQQKLYKDWTIVKEEQY